MLDWLKDHKFYVLLGVAVLVGAIVYYFSLQTNPFSGEQGIVSSSIDDGFHVDGEEMNEEEVEETLVDVKGAVANPGVYKAIAGERVVDLIEKAGGLTETANHVAINFAQRVVDEMVLFVPAIGEEGEGEFADFSGDASNNDKVNLNTASQAELETLPGIGPAKAGAIINYRETNGSFKTIEDLMLISGFGQKTFEKLKDSIRVK